MSLRIALFLCLLLVAVEAAEWRPARPGLLLVVSAASLGSAMATGRSGGISPAAWFLRATQNAYSATSSPSSEWDCFPNGPSWSPNGLPGI